MLERIRKGLSRVLEALGGGEPTVSREDVDRVLAGMRRELVEARAELQGRVERVEGYRRRLEALRERPGLDPSELAGLETEVARREAELAEHRRVVEELDERFREAVRKRDVLPAADRRSRASERLREAGEAGEGALGALERLEERLGDEERRRVAGRELEESLEEGGRAGATGSAAGAGRTGDVGDTAFREVEAETLLRELKRSMGLEPEGEGRCPGAGERPRRNSGEDAGERKRPAGGDRKKG